MTKSIHSFIITHSIHSSVRTIASTIALRLGKAVRTKGSTQSFNVCFIKFLVDSQILFSIEDTLCKTKRIAQTLDIIGCL